MDIDRIREETCNDPILELLKRRIERQDFSKHKKNPLLKPYLSSALDLYVLDDMVFKENLILVPERLREAVTKMVHQMANTGKTNAQKLMLSYFWFPNLTAFMEAEVALCETCQRIRDSPKRASWNISNPNQTI